MHAPYIGTHLYTVMLILNVPACIHSIAPRYHNVSLLNLLGINKQYNDRITSPSKSPEYRHTTALHNRGEREKGEKEKGGVCVMYCYMYSYKLS